VQVDLTVCCADVGSVQRGNFGWALRDYPDPLHEVPDHASISEFAAAIESRFQAGRSVALGFECPLFVPFREEPGELTRARRGEGNRSWSAGAGSGSLATGLVETVWLLARLRESLHPLPRLTVSWSDFAQTSGGLFLWEAFITRDAKAGSHHGDAGVAVESFCRALPEPGSANVIEEPRVFSLIGAAALRAGWDVPKSILSTPCLVVGA
jgi:hypothetical protein